MTAPFSLVDAWSGVALDQLAQTGSRQLHVPLASRQARPTTEDTGQYLCAPGRPGQVAAAMKNGALRRRCSTSSMP